ncbi:MAG: lysophospholipid acyltransferase family protein [Chthoniobacterales bacterium]
MKIEGWSGRVLIEIGLGIFRIWARTLRFKVEDPGSVVAAARDQPFIFAIWHNRLLMLPPVFDRCFPGRRSVGLISASRDGDLVSILIERSGYGTIRGSTSRKSVIALRQLADALAAGMNVLITPDGPRGPVYEANQGIIFVAQKSGAAVVPMNMEFSRAWRLKSWDRFMIPCPFSSVRVIFGGLHHVQPTKDVAEFEAERLRLQNAMLSIVEEK